MSCCSNTNHSCGNHSNACGGYIQCGQCGQYGQCSLCNQCGQYAQCGHCGQCSHCGRPPFPGHPFPPHHGCGRPPFMHPIYCNPACCSDAGTADGATLVIHKIVLEVCGNQSCTPRTFNIRITGPSYPNGEVFQLRAGSCLELDEPLVITGLEPGTYCIEELFTDPYAYASTITGPVCGSQVTLTNSFMPTVVTIVNRKRLGCRRCSNACSAYC